VAKLADAMDLKSIGVIPRAGSSPARPISSKDKTLSLQVTFSGDISMFYKVEIRNKSKKRKIGSMSMCIRTANSMKKADREEAVKKAKAKAMELGALHPIVTKTVLCKKPSTQCNILSS